MSQVKAATKKKRARGAVFQKRTPEEQRAEIERVALEHGADFSEEGFNEALRKVAKSK